MKTYVCELCGLVFDFEEGSMPVPFCPQCKADINSLREVDPSEVVDDEEGAYFI